MSIREISDIKCWTVFAVCTIGESLLQGDDTGSCLAVDGI